MQLNVRGALRLLQNLRRTVLPVRALTDAYALIEPDRRP